MDIHVYHHIDYGDSVTTKLDKILTLLRGVKATEELEMQELDTLKSKVEQTTTVEQSAIELLKGLSAQIASLKNDPVELQALADKLSSSSDELAAAVAANTPAA